MLEAYSKLCQKSKMMRQIENPGIFRKVYSGIFRRIEVHYGILRHIQTLLRRIESHSELCVTPAYTTVSYSEL